MTQTHGPWKIEETNEKYHNSFIHVSEDKVLRPDGKPGAYTTVKIKPGVAILPIDELGNVFLARQFRYALGQESLEVVCGAIEESDPALETAQRELEEELGIKAEEWIDLGYFNLDTSIVNCPVYLFLAKKLTFIQTNQEGTEVIEKIKLPLNIVVQMVMDSAITHGPSSVLILKAHNVLANS